MSSVIPPLVSSSPPPMLPEEEEDDDDFGDYTTNNDYSFDDVLSLPSTPQKTSDSLTTYQQGNNLLESETQNIVTNTPDPPVEILCKEEDEDISVVTSLDSNPSELQFSSDSLTVDYKNSLDDTICVQSQSEFSDISNKDFKDKRKSENSLQTEINCDVIDNLENVHKADEKNSIRSLEYDNCNVLNKRLGKDENSNLEHVRKIEENSQNDFNLETKSVGNFTKCKEVLDLQTETANEENSVQTIDENSSYTPIIGEVEPIADNSETYSVVQNTSEELTESNKCEEPIDTIQNFDNFKFEFEELKKDDECDEKIVPQNIEIQNESKITSIAADNFDEDDFTDFADFQTTVVATNEEDDFDDFGEFSSPITAAAPQLTVPLEQKVVQSVVSENSKELEIIELFSKKPNSTNKEKLSTMIREIFSNSFPVEDNETDDKSNTNAENEFPPDLLQKCELWARLEDFDNCKPITYRWENSSVYQKYLKIINMDTRNILYGSNINIPRFAALEPLKPVPVMKPSTTIDPTVNEQQSPQDVRSTENDSKDQFPAQFDWNDSGLINPLEYSQCNNALLLDLEELLNSLNNQQRSHESIVTAETVTSEHIELNIDDAWEYWNKSSCNIKSEETGQKIKNEDEIIEKCDLKKIETNVSEITETGSVKSLKLNDFTTIEAEPTNTIEETFTPTIEHPEEDNDSDEFSDFHSSSVPPIIYPQMNLRETHISTPAWLEPTVITPELTRKVIPQPTTTEQLERQKINILHSQEDEEEDDFNDFQFATSISNTVLSTVNSVLTPNSISTISHPHSISISNYSLPPSVSSILIDKNSISNATFSLSSISNPVLPTSNILSTSNITTWSNSNPIFVTPNASNYNLTTPNSVLPTLNPISNPVLPKVPPLTVLPISASPLEPIKLQNDTVKNKPDVEINWPDPGISEDQLERLNNLRIDTKIEKIESKPAAELEVSRIVKEEEDDDDWSDFVSVNNPSKIESKPKSPDIFPKCVNYPAQTFSNPKITPVTNIKTFQTTQNFKSEIINSEADDDWSEFVSSREPTYTNGWISKTNNCWSDSPNFPSWNAPSSTNQFTPNIITNPGHFVDTYSHHRQYEPTQTISSGTPSNFNNVKPVCITSTINRNQTHTTVQQTRNSTISTISALPDLEFMTPKSIMRNSSRQKK